jgi:FKBP-type peptidyl-prolyl cis-trans isomerase
MTVRVHYVASLPGGAVVHDSHDGGLPSEIVLGSTRTFCGFERALAGMRPGEQRRAVIPWSLAFGEKGRPPEVPPRTDLVVVLDLYLPADVAPHGGAPPASPAMGGRRR